jgi:hypothetical protein
VTSAEVERKFDELAKRAHRKIELRLVTGVAPRIDSRCRFCRRMASTPIGEATDEGDRQLFAFLQRVLEQHEQCGPS